MKRNVLEQKKRISALLLAVALILGAVPQSGLAVRAESGGRNGGSGTSETEETGTEEGGETETEEGGEAGTEEGGEAGTEEGGETEETETEEKRKNLDEHIFSVSPELLKKTYDGAAVSICDLFETGKIEITASKEGEDPVILHAGEDCVIFAETEGEWKDAGDYCLSVAPKEEGEYEFEKKELTYRIEPFALSEEAVELNPDEIYWTSDVISGPDLPGIVIRNGERVISPENYEIQIKKKERTGTGRMRTR